MRRFRITSIRICVSIIIMLAVVVSITSSTLYAFSDCKDFNTKMSGETIKNIEEQNITQSSQSLFDNKVIKSCEYLYNLDDSADYILIAFENEGYAILSSQTLDLIEFSLQGNLPYNVNNSNKYYAGPLNYLQKINNQFFDNVTGQKYCIDINEALEYSQRIRDSLCYDADYNQRFDLNSNNFTETIKNQNIYGQGNSAIFSYSAPSIDRDGLIYLTEGTGTLIPNYRFFSANPVHGDNFADGNYGNGNTGTCGPIAAQILLGYNNYYNDRRIIEDRFLNGYNDTLNEVTWTSLNPNFCHDPAKLTSMVTGTRSEDTGINSFYAEMISRIMEPNTRGSTILEVSYGISDYLCDQLPYDSFAVNYESSYSMIEPSIIKAEIDAGRPLILSMSENLGGLNHFVVGYGYQSYQYNGGEGTYDGYIVNFGWADSRDARVWINSAWCDGYISLKINHTHYYYTVGPIGTLGRIEYKCRTCGQRTDAAINMSASDRYVERITKIPDYNAYTYKDYYVTFSTAGNKLFQTFGSEDAKLYLFDSEYNQLAYNDDSGYSLNALFSYTVNANTPYILRVQLYDVSKSGTIKVGITAADTLYSRYEDIKMPGYYSAITNISQNTTKVMAFTPKDSGNYTFNLNSTYDNYLYVIDPLSSTALVSDVDFNDDGGTGLNAQLSKNLSAGNTYFIICSKYNPSTSFSSTDSPVISLSINKDGQSTPIPNYLTLQLTSRSGFIVYNWDVEITNSNPYAVQVTYNSKMCYGNDAINYTNLKDLVTITIPANGSQTVRINGNGNAGWIATCIDFACGESSYRRITCANGLSKDLTMNTPVNNQIDYK